MKAGYSCRRGGSRARLREVLCEAILREVAAADRQGQLVTAPDLARSLGRSIARVQSCLDDLRRMQFVRLRTSGAVEIGVGFLHTDGVSIHAAR